MTLNHSKYPFLKLLYCQLPITLFNCWYVVVEGAADSISCCFLVMAFFADGWLYFFFKCFYHQNWNHSKLLIILNYPTYKIITLSAIIFIFSFCLKMFMHLQILKVSPCLNTYLRRLHIVLYRLPVRKAPNCASWAMVLRAGLTNRSQRLVAAVCVVHQEGLQGQWRSPLID